MFFFSGGRRHTRWPRDWSSDVSSSDLLGDQASSYRRDRRPRAPAQALVAGQLLEQIDDLPAVAHEVPRGKIGAVESRGEVDAAGPAVDRKSTRLNSSHVASSYAVFCLKKNKLAVECRYSKP